jgi:hypothetical protein
MEVTHVRPGYELWRPNRESARNKSTKALVCLVLLISAALITIIVLGGWERLQDTTMAVIALAWAGVYVLFAYLVSRWNRGVLPVAASLAVVLAIFAAVAAPAWFDRAKDGLSSPALPEEMLGLLTIVLIPVQIMLIAVAMVAFNQEWHIEEERPVKGVPPADGDAAPSPA